MQESPGAIIKKVDNSNADGMQGATDNRRKVKIGNAKVQESPGAIVDKIDNSEANKMLGAIIIKVKIDNSKASEVLGAIIREKIDNSKASEVPGAIIKVLIDNSKQGAIYCQRQEEFERWKSIAKEGVRQSQICSGLHPRMKHEVPRVIIIIIHSRGILGVIIGSCI